MIRSRFCRLAIVTLGLALANRTDARPPDLPVDPRVSCPQCQERVEVEAAAAERDDVPGDTRTLLVPVHIDIVCPGICDLMLRLSNALVDLNDSGPVTDENRAGTTARQEDVDCQHARTCITSDDDVRDHGVRDHDVRDRLNRRGHAHCTNADRCRQPDIRSEIVPTSGVAIPETVAPRAPREPAPFPDVPYSDEDLFEDMLRSTRPLELVPLDRSLKAPSQRSEIEG